MKNLSLCLAVVLSVALVPLSPALGFGGPPPSTGSVPGRTVTNESGTTAGPNNPVVTPETAPKPATAPVMKTETAKPTSGIPAWYKVRVGIFSQKEGAESLKMKLAGEGFNAFLVQQAGLWRVQVGAFKEKARAEELTKELTAKGFQPDIIVTY